MRRWRPPTPLAADEPRVAPAGAVEPAAGAPRALNAHERERLRDFAERLTARSAREPVGWKPVGPVPASAFAWELSAGTVNVSYDAASASYRLAISPAAPGEADLVLEGPLTELEALHDAARRSCPEQVAYTNALLDSILADLDALAA